MERRVNKLRISKKVTRKGGKERKEGSRREDIKLISENMREEEKGKRIRREGCREW